MNINYLILAHANFNTLESLINELDNFNVKFYVHIDKRSPYPYVNTKPNVFILNNRLSVYWGRFSMVEATLELLRKSFEDDFNPDTRYVLLSGADYPIRPNFFIEDVLKEGWEHINISSAPSTHKPISRFHYFHFNYDKRNKKSLDSIFFYLLEKFLAKAGVKRKIPFQIYAGSQWFALTKSCVRHVLEQADSRPEYINFFKHCDIPDEAFFQTIIGNSPFINKVKNNVTFADWSSDPAPARMTDEHLATFASKLVFEGVYGDFKPLFARKFDDENLYLTNIIKETLRKKLPNDACED